MTPIDHEAFDRRGFSGPFPVLPPGEGPRLARVLAEAPAPLDWSKGHAATSPDFFAIASLPAVVDRVAALIGDDILLCGARLVRRGPGTIHPWHTDIETSPHEPGTVSVWIGLENTSRDSALRLIAGSHRCGITVQERGSQAATRRNDQSDALVLAWAREIVADCEIVQPEMQDGDAILFDGRLWHASHNTRGAGRRTALLLLYARPDRAIRIPDYGDYEFPFRFRDEPRPPCLLVRGRDTVGLNRLVAAPRAEALCI